MIELREGYWAVELPEGAYAFGFIDGSIICKLPDSKPGVYQLLSEAEEYMYKVGGEWEVVCTSRDATEAQAESIVDRHGKHFRDYSRDFNGLPLTVFTAVESIETLLTSKGCDLNKTYLILKKI